MEKIEQDKTLRISGELVREGLTEKGTFESKVEEGEGKNCRYLGEEHFQAEGATKAEALKSRCSLVLDKQ